MAANFIVEDGTGLSNATSYGTVDEFRQYCRDIGFREDQYPVDDLVQIALNKAAAYMEAAWAWRFLGERVSSTQALSWPRQYVPSPAACEYLPSDEVPTKVKEAQFEYALRALQGTTLMPDTSPVDATGQVIESSTKKVGPITKTVKYVVGSERALRSYPSADMKLHGFVTSSRGGVIRA
jgi:hypothetical protein